MNRKEIQGEVRVAGVPVAQALRVERAARLAREELGGGSWVEPARRLAKEFGRKVKFTRRTRD